nr:unnamed protein product [Callosobruchus chinensis]
MFSQIVLKVQLLYLFSKKEMRLRLKFIWRETLLCLHISSDIEKIEVLH